MCLVCRLTSWWIHQRWISYCWMWGASCIYWNITAALHWEKLITWTDETFLDSWHVCKWRFHFPTSLLLPVLEDSILERFAFTSVILSPTCNSVKSFCYMKRLNEIKVQSCWWNQWFPVGLCNDISFPRESMSSVPLLDCVITKPSLYYETIQHMVRGGDSFDVLL